MISFFGNWAAINSQYKHTMDKSPYFGHISTDTPRTSHGTSKDRPPGVRAWGE